MKKYSLQVTRQILVLTIVEASSEEEALEKYQQGQILSEDILDSDDIEDPSVKLEEE